MIQEGGSFSGFMEMPGYGMGKSIVAMEVTPRNPLRIKPRKPGVFSFTVSRPRPHLANGQWPDDEANALRHGYACSPSTRLD